MEALTTLDILYIVLSIFTVIVWTLLSIVLFRIIKVLWPVMEIITYYKKVKKYLSIYKQIPNMVKKKIFDLLWKNSDDTSK